MPFYESGRCYVLPFNTLELEMIFVNRGILDSEHSLGEYAELQPVLPNYRRTAT